MMVKGKIVYKELASGKRHETVVSNLNELSSKYALLQKKKVFITGFKKK